MLGDDAMGSNRSTLCNVARSASWNSPFFLCVSHFAQHTMRADGGAEGSPIYQPSPPQNICNYSGSHVAMGFLKQSLRLLLAVMCVWCMWQLLSTVLVVSLGWPQPGSGRGSVGSDVITSLIGSHQSQLCAPPHISHMLSLPPPLFQWTLSHSLLRYYP